MLKLIALLSLTICFHSCHGHSYQKHDKKLRFAPRPPHSDKTRMARYIAHTVDWCVVGTVSTMDGRRGLPFTNVMSVVDGPVSNSTGVPYFYVTDYDQSMKDVKGNNNVSITMSESQTGFCSDHDIDPESPLCTRLTLGGRFVRVTDEDELSFAQNALFSRHPEMKAWITAHVFYVAKLEVEFIWLIDFYGGASIIDPKDYFDVSM